MPGSGEKKDGPQEDGWCEDERIWGVEKGGVGEIGNVVFGGVGVGKILQKP